MCLFYSDPPKLVIIGWFFRKGDDDSAVSGLMVVGDCQAIPDVRVRGQDWPVFRAPRGSLLGRRSVRREYFVWAADNGGDDFLKKMFMRTPLAAFTAFFANNVGMPHTMACCTTPGILAERGAGGWLVARPLGGRSWNWSVDFEVFLTSESPAYGVHSCGGANLSAFRRSWVVTPEMGRSD